MYCFTARFPCEGCVYAVLHSLPAAGFQHGIDGAGSEASLERLPAPYDASLQFHYLAAGFRHLRGHTFSLPTHPPPRDPNFLPCG